MTVPYTFGTATTSIPLSNLDANFNTPITLGNTSIYLGNTTTTIGNLTLTNATISSGTVNITNVTVTTANVTNITVSGTTTLSGLTASTALALDASKNVVSVTNTGTGNNVLSANPTLTGTIAGASLSLSSLTASQVTFASASGLLSDSANFIWDNTNARLGIGTSPSFKLHISQTGNASSQAYNVNTDTGAGVYVGYIASTDKNETALRSYGSGFTTFTHAGISLANFTELWAGVASSTGPAGMLLGVESASPIIFATNNTEKMRITSAGLVGIGTSSPAGKFDITGASNSTVNSYFRAHGGTSARANMILDMYTTTAAAAGNLTFQRAHDNTLGGITDVSSGDVLGNINFYGTSRGDGSYNSGGNIQVKVNGAASTYVPADMYIYTNSGSTDRSGNPQLTIHSNGTIRFLSTISVGNATPSTSGAGVTFLATQDPSSDANTLDDYEEGTWTPSVGGTATYVAQSGTYTKTGRVVTAQFEVYIGTLGTGNTTSITGLPFASGSTGNGQGGSIGYFSGSANSIYFITARLDQNSTTIGFAVLTSAGVTISTSTAFFTDNTRILGTITYMA